MKYLGRIVTAVISVTAAASIAVNVYLLFFQSKSYLESPEQIYIMESGILKNSLEFAEGKKIEFQYVFDNSEYPQLLSDYNISEIAGNGTEFEKAMNLMNEFAPRLRHESNYDNHIEMNALSLLEYSLDNKNHGINCRNKAQILNEMCLALGIYSRKVWIIPNSEYDNDCHVVNEVWDSSFNKWVMLDITNNQYWADENGTPLSVLEIRQKGALREFCTPVAPGDDTSDLGALKEKHISEFLYIMKNMVYMKYLDVYTVGEGSAVYTLVPENMAADYEYIISESACLSSPY